MLCQAQTFSDVLSKVQDCEPPDHLDKWGNGRSTDPFRATRFDISADMAYNCFSDTVGPIIPWLTGGQANAAGARRVE